ncbi:MAG: hypothetical protein AAGC53_10305 [Actinomycetota bacterium]
MEPPICEITGDEFDPDAGGRRVRFQPIAGTSASPSALAVGASPDEGWFSAAFVSQAETLAATHTLTDAVRAIRLRLASDASAQRDATRTRIILDPAHPIDHVVTVTEAWLLDALERLGLDTVEPSEAVDRSTAASPEWRDDATTTTEATTTTWATATHRIEYRFEDIHWDGPGGRSRTGGLLQGVISLKLDDVWLFAPFGADATVDRIDRSGVAGPVIAALVDELVAALSGGSSR